jgi:hypothetical protein
VLLEQWFGAYLPRLLEQGAYIAQYSVPTHVVVQDSPEQVLFVHRRAAVIERWGHEAPAQLIRSSAGSRATIMAASDGKYDFRARSGDRSGDRASSMNRAR